MHRSWWPLIPVEWTYFSCSFRPPMVVRVGSDDLRLTAPGWARSLCSDSTLTILPRSRSISGLEAAGIEDKADLACC